jgi:hypothetical protein
VDYAFESGSGNTALLQGGGLYAGKACFLWTQNLTLASFLDKERELSRLAGKWFDQKTIRKRIDSL